LNLFLKAIERKVDIMSNMLVIFDMDGLMVDTEILHFAAWKSVLNEVGIDYQKEIFRLTIGRTKSDTDMILKQCYGEEIDINDLHTKKSRLIESMLSERVDVKPGLYELFDYLEIHGMKKVVATSSPKKLAEYILDKINVLTRIDGLITEDDIVCGKPDPEIFLKALNFANAKAGSAIILEDSKYGLMSAVQAGIRCIFVPDQLPADDEILSWAYRIAISLHDVPDILKSIECSSI